MNTPTTLEALDRLWDALRLTVVELNDVLLRLKRYRQGTMRGPLHLRLEEYRELVRRATLYLETLEAAGQVTDGWREPLDLSPQYVGRRRTAA